MVPQACHKGEVEEASTSYLSGTLTFDIPLFVNIGQELTMTPRGASNPTGDVGYYWYSSWNSAKDTVKTEAGSGDGSWTVTVPVAYGTHTIYAIAFAEDYYSLSATKTFTVVDPSLDGSLTNAGYQTDSLKFTDPRDGAIYYLATSGGNVWMQNNLYYSGSGVSYEYSDAMDPILGRLYNWDEAVEVCPEGWRLPSDADFAALVGSEGETFEGSAGKIMADVYFNGSKMWTFWPEVKITNSTKFSAIPAGYAVDNGEGSQKYVGTNSYATFWTADENGNEGIYRYIYVSKDSIYKANGDKKSFRASVRCVKE